MAADETRPDGPAPGWDDERGARPAPPAPTGGAGVLDRPVDDVDLRERLARPGTARSTRVLLGVLAAVAVFALGSFVGRATAPETGPGSVPETVGIVESVEVLSGDFPLVTVRSGDGSLTTLQTTPGTVVAVPRGRGAEGVTVGAQVVMTGERDARGRIVATRVDLPLG